MPWQIMLTINFLHGCEQLNSSEFQVASSIIGTHSGPRSWKQPHDPWLLY